MTSTFFVCCTFSPIQYNRIVATKTLYVCSNCGHQAPKWLGRCPDCGEWSTFVEEVRESKKVVGFAERTTERYIVLSLIYCDVSTLATLAFEPARNLV